MENQKIMITNAKHYINNISVNFGKITTNHISISAPIKIILTEKICDRYNITLGRARLEAARRSGKICVINNPIVYTTDRMKIEAIEYEESPAINRDERRHGVKKPSKCWQKDWKVRR